MIVAFVRRHVRLIVLVLFVIFILAPLVALASVGGNIPTKP